MDVEDDYETHITFISELGATETIFNNHKQQSVLFVSHLLMHRQGKVICEIGRAHV